MRGLFNAIIRSSELTDLQLPEGDLAFGEVN
jgi:hypothetical protein